jgi:hypothetical protein
VPGGEPVGGSGVLPSPPRLAHQAPRSRSRSARLDPKQNKAHEATPQVTLEVGIKAFAKALMRLVNCLSEKR